MQSSLISVFISSTWLDLQPERNAVEKALQQLKLTKFIGMEYFGSNDENTCRTSLKKMDNCQLYIGIFAGRYGSGITEAEYNRARELKLPCHIYFKKKENILQDKWESNPEWIDSEGRVAKNAFPNKESIQLLFKEKAIKDDGHKSGYVNFDDDITDEAHLRTCFNQLNINEVETISAIWRYVKLIKLKKRLLKAHTISTFNTPDDLAAKVVTDISNWLLKDLDSKLNTYIANMTSTPEFADWNQQHYFELQLGKERTDFDIRMRLNVSLEDTSNHIEDKLTVDEAIRRFRRLVIIGEPGSGKTTALRRLAINFAEAFGKNTQQDSQTADEPLPIYIWLPHFNSVLGNTLYDRVLALIRDAFQRLEIDLSDDDVKKLIHNHYVALLFDGLNEIGDKSIGQFLDGLATFASNHDQHLFVITSRTHNFQLPDKNKLPILELLELTYPEGIEQYISCYLDLPSDVKQLMQILKTNYSMRKLALNPLLLLMILLVFKYEKGKVPNSRGQLFDKIARGQLGQWKFASEAKTPRRFWLEDKHNLLAHLGYAMKDEGLELPIDRIKKIFQDALVKDTDFFSSNNPLRPINYRVLSPKIDWMEFVNELKRDRILFETRRVGYIRFWHQTMQEYFAACYIWNEIQPVFNERQYPGRLDRRNLKKLKNKLKIYIDDPRWHEILAIVGGLISGEKADEGHKSSAQLIVAFIDKVWHKNKLLAAMCLSNVEQFNNADKLTGYLKRLQKNVYLLGIVLPRFYPWFILVSLLIIVWLIPQKVTAPIYITLQNTLDLSGMVAHMSEASLAIILGSFTMLLFFRLCANGIEKIEIFTNARFIHPAISALRYIRNDFAEHLLAEFNTRIKNDFSIGDTTRLTIQNGLVPPARDESELILMLDNEKTRLQAIERLCELGSERGIDRLCSLVDQDKLDDLSYGTAIRSIVNVVKLQPSHSQSRVTIEHQLKKILSREMSYFKRFNAYKGLLVMGITDVKPPEKGIFQWIKIGIIPILIFLFLLLVGYLFFRKIP